MTRNADRQRIVPAMQPACLQEKRQSADVIRVGMRDPYCVKIGERHPKLQKLQTARLAIINKHAQTLNIEEHARLKAPRDPVSGTRPQKSYR